MSEVDIVSYSPNYAADFKRISYEWIAQYFGIEAADRQLVDHHKTQIIDTGGTILFAKTEGKIVGTCALIKHLPDYYELAKMGVVQEYQGRKIGYQLAKAILDKARDFGAKKVFLESSSQLKAALALYHKLGFRQDPELKITPQCRCNTQLAITL